MSYGGHVIKTENLLTYIWLIYGIVLKEFKKDTTLEGYDQKASGKPKARAEDI